MMCTWPRLYFDAMASLQFASCNLAQSVEVLTLHLKWLTPRGSPENSWCVPLYLLGYTVMSNVVLL